MYRWFAVNNDWFRGKVWLKDGGQLSFASHLIILDSIGMNDHACISISYLVDVLGFSQTNRKSRASIKEALQFLFDNGIVTLHRNRFNREVIEFNKDEIMVDTMLHVSVPLLESNYTKINKRELEEILTYEKLDAKNRRAMLAQFCTIVSFINMKNKVSFPSFDTLKNITGIGSNLTCSRYNDALVSLGLLVFDNANVFVCGNSIKVSPNLYARPEYAKELEEAVNASAVRSTKRINGIVKKELANKKRHYNGIIRWYTRVSEERDLTLDEKIKMDDAVEQYELLAKIPKPEVAPEKISDDFPDENELCGKEVKFDANKYSGVYSSFDKRNNKYVCTPIKKGKEPAIIDDEFEF